MRRAAVVLLLALTATCAPLPTLHAPSSPRMAHLIADNIGVLDSTTMVMQFPAPPIYAFWRAEVELCAGRHRPGDATYWVAQRTILNAAGALGPYVRDERRIVLGLGNETVPWIVRHEMLHDILDLPRGVDPHPEAMFKKACGRWVFPPGMYE